jgi:hypothetical protein
MKVSGATSGVPRNSMAFLCGGFASLEGPAFVCGSPRPARALRRVAVDRPWGEWSPGADLGGGERRAVDSTKRKSVIPTW